MYSYGSPHMAVQKQDDQHEHTFSNYVRIRDVVQKTCQRRWTIGKSGERGSGISVLPARHDDDDDDIFFIYVGSFNDWYLYGSIASNKAFIRWWLWVQVWFWGWSIITTNPEHHISNSRYHQTLLDCRYSMGLLYPHWFSLSLFLALFYVFPLKDLHIFPSYADIPSWNFLQKGPLIQLWRLFLI